MTLAAKKSEPSGGILIEADHFHELKVLVDDLASCDHDMTSQPPERKFEAVPG